MSLQLPLSRSHVTGSPMVVLTSQPSSTAPLGWNRPVLSHSASFVAPPPSLHYSLVLPHAHAVQCPSQAVADRSQSPRVWAHPVDVHGNRSFTQVPQGHVSSQSGQVFEAVTTPSNIVPKIRGVPLTRSTSTTVTPRASSIWTSPNTRGSPSDHSSIDTKMVDQLHEGTNDPSEITYPHDSSCGESELPGFSPRGSVQWTYPVDKHSAPTSARSSSRTSKLGETDVRLAAAAHRRSRLDACGTPLPEGAPARPHEQCFVDLYADALERHTRRRERLEKVEQEKSKALRGSLSARTHSSRPSTPTRSSLKSYFERAEKYKARTEERMALKEAQARERSRKHEEEELQQCTFRPQINSARRSNLKRSDSVDSHTRDVPNLRSRSLANLSDSSGDCRRSTDNLSKVASKGSLRPMRLSLPSRSNDQQGVRSRDSAVAEIKEMLRKEGLALK